MLQQPFSQGNLKCVLQESWGLLVFVSPGHYEKNWKVFVHKLSVGKEIINLNKDQITGNSSISNRYGTCQTIQAFQEFVNLGWQWKRNARQTLPWACHRHPMEKRLSHYLSLILSLTKLQCFVLKSKPTPSKLNHWSSELRMETIESSFKMFKTHFELPEMRKQRC